MQKTIYKPQFHYVYTWMSVCSTKLPMLKPFRLKMTRLVSRKHMCTFALRSSQTYFLSIVAICFLSFSLHLKRFEVLPLMCYFMCPNRVQRNLMQFAPVLCHLLAKLSKKDSPPAYAALMTVSWTIEAKWGNELMGLPQSNDFSLFITKCDKLLTYAFGKG